LGFYAEWILPALIDLSMRNKRLRPYRERTAGAAEGRVLDIGIGSGLNLPFYAQKAREVFGLDPSLPLLARAQSKAPHAQTPVLEGSAERIPLADHSMDTIVMTWTGCSIPGTGSVLADAPKSKNAKVTLVYQHELPNVPGKSIKGVLVEYGPGGYSPGHTHAKSAGHQLME
jgi:SAM-dependent methyltransferase